MNFLISILISLFSSYIITYIARKQGVKNHFLNFKREENVWDVGWPLGPRKFTMILIPLITTTVLCCLYI